MNLETTKFAALKFYADWCYPCKTLAPIVEEVAQLTSVPFYEIDADTSPLTKQFNIRSLPTIVFVSYGKEIDRVIGAVPKAVLLTKTETARNRV